MQLNLNRILSRSFYFVSLLMLFSCASTKNVAYFENTPQGQIASNTPIPESIIQKNDILGITISDIDPKNAEPYNLKPTGTNNNGSATSVGNAEGYLVNSDGNIQLITLGNIKAEGLTKAQLGDKIRKAFLDKKLLIDPIITIRFLNFRITVLGEVNRPTVVTVPNEKISLLEAIGLAGDLTIYGKRENVLVIREEKNQKTIKRINLNSGELFTSPYYYLQSNDIVYVEPSKVRIASAKNASTAQWLPALFSALSVIAIVADRLIK
jgi:polysaccharide biosynthesis/export protein